MCEEEIDFEPQGFLEEVLCENCMHKDECEYANDCNENKKCDTYKSLE